MDIDEDWNGHLWFATQGGGVSRFDGKQFFRYDKADGLTSNVVTDIFVSSKHKRIWFATDDGVTCYKDERFFQYREMDGLASKRIDTILEDRNGDLLVDGPIGILNIIGGNDISSIEYPPYLANGMLLLKTGDVLLAGSRGDLFGFRNKQFFQFEPSSVPGGHEITAILQDSDHNLWFTTRNDGIFRYSAYYQRFDSLSTEIGLSTDNDHFYELIEDREKNIWFVGDGGLVKLSDNKFITFGRQEGLHSSFGHTVCEDMNGKIWAGFRDGSIAQLGDKKTTIFRNQDVALAEVLSLMPSKAGGIWVGHSRGLSLLKNDRFTRIDRDCLTRFSLFENQQGHLWAGGYLGNVAYFNGTKFDIIETSLPATQASDVVCILERKNGEVWFGTRKNGLYRFINGKAIKISANFRANGINAFYEDEDQILWIATDGQGLYRFADSDFFQYTFTEHNLSFDRLFSILEDDLGHLWFSGNRGVFSVSKDSLNRLANMGAGTLNCQIYNHLDGMREAECNGRRQPVAWKSRDGKLWFASIAGIVSVDPLNMPVNTDTPFVHIETVTANEDSVIEVDYSALRLDAHNRDIEFQYTACSFTVPERVKFKYRLEGYDNDWIDADTRRVAFYTNLGKGDYVFRVKACNNDGVWNEKGASLAISIPPFWWETWWAFALYGLVFFGFLYSLRRYEMSRQQLKHNLELEHTEAEKLHELDRMKSCFFANISHEFRTPLTLILGPLGRLRKGGFSGDVKRQYGLMERNARRLLRLINQLLDLSKLDAGKLKLEAREGDIIHFLKGVLSSFESLASERKIGLDVEGMRGGTDSSPLMVYFDREKLEKVIINLIANAFKFTQEGGRISVRLSKYSGGSGSADYLQIRVKDTGTGIPAEHFPHVFDQFYQVGTSEKEGDVGSGIGLALTKELVELHRGTIEVRSEVNSGTEFLISLLLGKDHLNADEIVEDAVPDPGSDGEIQKYVVEPEFVTDEPHVGEAPEVNSHTQLIVLIVDDNKDMRAYLRDVLIGNYQVIEAADGEEGLQKAFAVLPDVIVSDVMMPKIDGFEFCKLLKSNELTSHIPIVLLTAKSSDKSKIEGLETGADAYLTKPFSHEELSVRLRKLIEQRKRLQQKFRKQITVVKVEPEKIDLPSRDQEFLDRAKTVVEKNMDDPDFSAEKFAAKMYISKVHLNRKLKALTDEHTSNFVLLMRLQRAAQMLKQDSGTISEIAYQVGFNNLSHFNREFKKQFATTPSVYKK